jgi:hypothetical protein
MNCKLSELVFYEDQFIALLLAAVRGTETGNHLLAVNVSVTVLLKKLVLHVIYLWALNLVVTCCILSLCSVAGLFFFCSM